VKRLSSIQNFGSMDVLCTDKTGTLTENTIKLVLHVDMEGNDNEKVLRYSFLNSYHQTGLKSPLDEAILKHEEIDIKDYQKIDEIPFDFTRRRVSVVVARENKRSLISKGAPEEILKVCTSCDVGGSVVQMDSELHEKIGKNTNDLSSEGFRVLGVAYRNLTEDKQVHSVNDEIGMVFLGFVAFIDPQRKRLESRCSF